MEKIIIKHANHDCGKTKCDIVESNYYPPTPQRKIIGEKGIITMPLEVADKLNDIIWQDMNFHNPYEIVIQAREFLLKIGVSLRKKP